MCDVLYIDNMVGYYAKEEREIPEHDFDIFEGITFENIMDQRLMKEASGENTASQLSRVSYADEAILTDEMLGMYGMKATVSRVKWPTFTLYFGEVIPASSIVTFSTYVKVDPEEQHRFKLESKNNILAKNAYPFNEWFEVSILVQNATDSFNFFYNFDQSILGLGLESGYMFGDQDVAIYMDNFKVSQGVPNLETNNGVITIRNYAGSADLSYDMTRSFKKGEVVSFDIDFNTSEKLTLWVLEEGKWGAGNETRFMYEKWLGKRTVTVKLNKDVEYLRFRVRYYGDGDKSKNECVISNVQVGSLNYKIYEGLTFEKDLEHALVTEGQSTARNTHAYPTKVAYADKNIKTIEGLGQYGMQCTVLGNALYPDFYLEYPKTIGVGERLTFMVYVASENPGDATYKIESVTPATETTGKVVHSVSRNCVFNEWFEVTVTLRGSADQQWIFFNFDDGNNTKTSIFGDKEIHVYLDNFKLSSAIPEVTVKDGVTTLRNVDGDDTLTYKIEKPMKQGEVLTLDVDFNTDEKLTMWFSENGQKTSDNQTIFVESDWSGKKNIAIRADKDIDFIQFDVKFYGAGDMSKKECTLTNLAVGTPEYDYYQSLGFETSMEHGMVQNSAPGKTASGTKSITPSRVTYADEKMDVPEKLGKYGLRADVHTGGMYPEISLNYGETVAAGMKLKFMAYIDVENPGDVSYKMESKTNGVSHMVTSEYALNKWFEVTVTLKEDTDIQWLFFNFKKTVDGKDVSVFGNKEVTIYFDDFKLVPDYCNGVSFENPTEANVITGETDLVTQPQRVALAEENIPLSTYGDYAIKLDVKENGCKPTFNMNYVETLSAGTTIRFMAYVDVDATGIDYTVKSAGHTVIAPNGYKLNEWYEVRMTINEAIKIQDIIFDFTATDSVSKFGTKEVNIYVDNFQMVIDYYAGLTFNNESEAGLIIAGRDVFGNLLRVKYPEGLKTTVTGEYGLKMNVKQGPTDGRYPTFNVNYGETVTNGKKLTFMAYVDVKEPGNITYKMESKTGDTKNTISADYKLNEWFAVEVLLNADTETQNIFFNFNDNTENVSKFGDQEVTIYMDNFKLIEETIPAVIDFYQGVTFENPAEIERFTEMATTAANYCQVECVSYTDSMAGNTKYGAKGLVAKRIANASGKSYMQFYVDFGTAVSKGSTMTFDFYIKGETATTSATGLKIDFKKAGSSWLSRTVSAFTPGQWNTITYTFDKDDAVSEGFFMVELGTLFAGEEVKVYMDNFKIVPSVASEEIDFYQGVSFENAKEIERFSEMATTAANYCQVECVSYTDSMAGNTKYGAKGLVAKRTANASGKSYMQFYVDFGTSVQRGSTMTFDFYIQGETTTSSATGLKIDFKKAGSSWLSRTVSAFTPGQWNTITYTFDKDDTVSEGFFMVELGTLFAGEEVKVYFDNIKITKP